jgi:carboxylesterase
MSTSVWPEALPIRHDGGPAGALVLHGFTGSPDTVRPQADAFGAAGFSVLAPRLPGHGTTLDDMATTRWSDWSGEVERAYGELSVRCERVVVLGLSMGGALACWLAARHPEIAGIVTINASVRPFSAEEREFVGLMLDAGDELAPGLGADLAAPDARERVYDGTPLRALLSLWDAIDELQDALPAITCPALVMNSAVDHVVTPPDVVAEHLASRVGGPVERLVLERSYHVATLDYDKDLISERAIAFAISVY